jgi:hypothetical protein
VGEGERAEDEEVERKSGEVRSRYPATLISPRAQTLAHPLIVGHPIYLRVGDMESVGFPSPRLLSLSLSLSRSLSRPRSRSLSRPDTSSSRP